MKRLTTSLALGSTLLIASTGAWAAMQPVDVNINSGSFIPRDTNYSQDYHKTIDGSPADLSTLLKEQPTAAGPIDANIINGQWIPRDTNYAFRYYKQRDGSVGKQSTDINSLLKEQPTAAGPVDVNINGGQVIPRDSNYIRHYYRSESNSGPMGRDAN